MDNPLPAPLLELCKSVTKKRPRVVIDHLLQHGFITNAILEDQYGYQHGPRAIRDVREAGIHLLNFAIPNPDPNKSGTVVAYKFDTTSEIVRGRIGGRSAFPANFKTKLIKKYGSRVTTTNEPLEARYLQIDHRIPYEIAGNSANLTDLDAFMLLDASAQRQKSWSCENCINFKESKDLNECRKCFWAFPENYEHVAMTYKKYLQIEWSHQEFDELERVTQAAEKQGVTVQELIKSIIKTGL